jgi:ribosomal protein L37AE/L43A
MMPPPHHPCHFCRWELGERTPTWRTWRCRDCGTVCVAPVNRTRQITWRPRRVQLTVQELLEEA